ncbi:hypothetical protein GLW20_15920 [Virgibacillus halodenitrificans]|nr:hypothetical protein [Virgibacillus halodenitrificans]
MPQTLEETYGNLVLCQLFTNIWFGEWNEYEKRMEEFPKEVSAAFPFHAHYDREETALWRENYFTIPGEYFIPPYLSSYYGKSEEQQEKARQDILCLIGEFDKLGFYYPLKKKEFPDHFGSLTAFFTAALNEQVKAIQQQDKETRSKLNELLIEVYRSYMKASLEKMLQHSTNKLSDPFFQAFIPYYVNNMQALAIEV